VAIAGVLTLALTGCTPPVDEPTQTTTTAPTPSATPTPTPTPTPNLPTLTPPRQFDLVHPLRLSPVDQVNTGVLSGDYFITLNANTVWGINVHDGSVGFSTPLDGPAPSCWKQVVDPSHVYTVTLSETDPVDLRVSAVDRGSGELTWTFQPLASDILAGADCGSATNTLTLTKQGLMLSLSQTDQATPGTPTTSRSWMLDPSSGQPVWQSNTAVLATDGADFGVSVALATISTPMGVFFYQASPVNLATGEIGPAFWQTANSAQLAGRYQLAGRTGDNLLLLAQTPGMITTTTVYQVSASTGAATPQPIVRLQATNLDRCQLGPSDVLICTLTDDPVMAFGVSLADGSTAWQHAFKTPESASTPVLFGGYLYGFDPNTHASYVLNAADGSILQVGLYPPAIAVKETGLVFSVPGADGKTAWQCWWAPALA